MVVLALLGLVVLPRPELALDILTPRVLVGLAVLIPPDLAVPQLLVVEPRPIAGVHCTET